jgi:DNA-binding NarL/FixJ family response regulator
MSEAIVWAYATHDAGLLAHWQKALEHTNAPCATNAANLSALGLPDGATVWVDLSLPGLPTWQEPAWQHFSTYKVIAASSNPKDSEAIAALDAGCVGYCHAFSEANTLRQIGQVVSAGHVWIGPTLMQRLIRSANQAANLVLPPAGWAAALTVREKQVATMAAKGASNMDIATQCNISERTVKAHLSATFEKLGVADRLQLTLKVHGIQ